MDKKKIACSLLSLSLVASLSAPAMAANTPLLVAPQSVEQTEYTLKSFSDVPSNHWAHKAIMTMVQKGMVSGTSAPDANGIGTFAPDAPMTRSQFLTIVTRYLYPDEVDAMKSKLSAGTAWYEANYQVAIDKGLITKSEFENRAELLGNNPINKPMSRQEMALVLVRAMEAKGEDTSDKISIPTIADFEKIAPQYRDYVRVAYKAGLISGTDKAGTFAPSVTLSRAQASMVLYRLVVPESRTPGVDKVETPTTPSTGGGIENSGVGDMASGRVEEVAGNQTWKEGEPHAVPKAGDTVIKKDGTKVVLKMYTLPSGTQVLGLFQGVDIATGVKNTNGTITEVGDTGWTDPSTLIKDPKTGECYTQQQWVEIRGLMDVGNPGKSNGEIRMNWFKWHENVGAWGWIGPKC